MVAEIKPDAGEREIVLGAILPAGDIKHKYKETRNAMAKKGVHVLFAGRDETYLFNALKSALKTLKS
jgi:hypothetical protein